MRPVKGDVARRALHLDENSVFAFSSKICVPLVLRITLCETGADKMINVEVWNATEKRRERCDGSKLLRSPRSLGNLRLFEWQVVLCGSLLLYIRGHSDRTISKTNPTQSASSNQAQITVKPPQTRLFAALKQTPP